MDMVIDVLLHLIVGRQIGEKSVKMSEQKYYSLVCIFKIEVK